MEIYGIYLESFVFCFEIMRENDINLLWIYDIDGIIIMFGYDLWYLIICLLFFNFCRFDKYIELWKDSLRKGDGLYELFKVMM